MNLGTRAADATCRPRSNDLPIRVEKDAKPLWYQALNPDRTFATFFEESSRLEAIRLREIRRIVTNCPDTAFSICTSIKKLSHQRFCMTVVPGRHLGSSIRVVILPYPSE